MKNIRRLICLFLTVALLAALWGCASGPEGQNYRQGKAALNDGRLAEAAEYFGPLAGYKDSESYLNTIYDRAMACYDAGEYREAAEAFEVLAVYEIGDAQAYAAASGALACLAARDGAGVRAHLAEADQEHPAVAAAQAEADLQLFEGTVVFRPEIVAELLASGQVETDVSDISDDPRSWEYLYTMDRRAAERVYKQYREYCRQAFADTFRDESDNYFSFQVEGATYYVSNFSSVDGGLVIRVPKY